MTVRSRASRAYRPASTVTASHRNSTIHVIVRVLRQYAFCSGTLVSTHQTLGRLLQLLQDRRVLERGDILGDGLALGDGAQQAAHDLAGARLWQVVAEADVLGLGDGADFLADPVAQLLGDLQRLIAGRTRALEHDEGAHRL